MAKAVQAQSGANPATRTPAIDAKSTHGHGATTIDAILPLVHGDTISKFKLCDALSADDAANWLAPRGGALASFIFASLAHGDAEERIAQAATRLMQLLPERKQQLHFLGAVPSDISGSSTFIVTARSDAHAAHLNAVGGRRRPDGWSLEFQGAVTAHLRCFVGLFAPLEDTATAHAITMCGGSVAPFQPDGSDDTTTSRGDGTIDGRIRDAVLATPPPRETARFALVMSMIRSDVSVADALALFESASYTGARRDRVLAKVGDIYERYARSFS